MSKSEGLYTIFEDLKGEVFSKVEKVGDDEIHFHTIGGISYVLRPVERDGALNCCCVSVYIESIVGDLTDLENSQILMAEKVNSRNTLPIHDMQEPCNTFVPKRRYRGDDKTNTWTFFKLATIKGYVDIRFLGESNGAYAEDAGLWMCNTLDLNDSNVDFEDKDNSDEYGNREYVSTGW